MGWVIVAAFVVLGFAAVYRSAVRDSDWWLLVGVALVTSAVVGAARMLG